ncbi:MAG: hypothetical protein CSA39_01665 [Flavobacteriales bacterium]|nr:MAG: hypothetical protein CSA39_01665 [Flavobacteriales bacterium]
MKTKYILKLFLLWMLFSCREGNQGTTTVEELKNKSIPQSQENSVQNISLNDSINNTLEILNELISIDQSYAIDINALNKKKDSLNNVLEQVKNSLNQVNAKKIVPGIEGVNTKLSELKGQRETAVEQLALQEQEIVLAEKKITLLNEEKTVYDAQHKALWDKGAAPDEFKEVDSLLSGINTRISEQLLKVKKLKNNVADVKEQITSIDVQRNSLSSKIRNNYTAKEIFDQYAEEEQRRLANQLATLNADLALKTQASDSIKNQIAIYSNTKTTYEVKKANADRLEMITQKEKEDELARLEQLRVDEENLKKSKKRKSTFLIIGAVAGLLILLYIIGKMRKTRKNK